MAAVHVFFFENYRYEYVSPRFSAACLENSTEIIIFLFTILENLRDHHLSTWGAAHSSVNRIAKLMAP